MMSVPNEGSLASGTPSTDADLNPRTFRWAVVAILAVFLAVWLGHFPWIYGWNRDDYLCYGKGRDTLENPQAAFTVFRNLHQPYFFLYSYLPLKSGLGMPSYELPTYGADTGNFRFFLLYTIFFHAGIVLLWAWFALKTCGNRLAALLSTVLLATSLELVVWTPEPETRFAGFPLALLGLRLLMIEPDAGRFGGWRHARRLFGAGSLFGLAQSLHYTALYLIVPVCIVFCLQDLWRRRRPDAWLQWLAFLLGCAWLQIGLELLSHYWVGLPWSEGPTMSMLRQNAENPSPHGLGDQLAIWRENLTSMLGIPLLLAAAVGAWRFARGRDVGEVSHRVSISLRERAGVGDPAAGENRNQGDPPSPPAPLPQAGEGRPGVGLFDRAFRDAAPLPQAGEGKRRALVAAVVLGLLILLFKPSIPVVRQFSNLEPLLLLFAAQAIVDAAGKFRRRAVRAIVCVALLAAVDAVPMWRSCEVFQAHLNLGRTIDWAYRNRGQREIRWLLPRKPFEYTPRDLLRDDPENWVIVYKPDASLELYPELFHALETVPPLRSAPNIWATHWFHRSLIAQVDLSLRPIVSASQVRVYRVGDLAAVLHPAKTLRVESVTASSCQSRWTEAANLFDHDASPDGNMYWISADQAGPQSVEVVLEKPETLSEVHLVGPYFYVPRVSTLEILASSEKSGGAMETIWRGSGLYEHPLIEARWEPRRIARLKFIAAEPRTLHRTSRTVRIDEIIFPGYRAEGPPITRPLPPMTLAEVHREGGELIAAGENISRDAVLLVDGVPLAGNGRSIPIREKFTFNYVYRSTYWTTLRAVLPSESGQPPRRREVYLRDACRRSNSLGIEW
jgi:hypothetical protein